MSFETPTRRSLALPLTLCVCLAGCDEEPRAIDDEVDDELRTGSLGWDPQWIDPNLCQNPELEPSRPPQSGVCEIEVRLAQTVLVTGQGPTEGRAEISVAATGEVAGSGSVTEAYYPAPPLAGTGLVPIDTYNAPEAKGMDLSLGTYTVAEGQTETVEVCVTFTEHDDGGLNGSNDTAEICSNLLLECDPQQGQPSYERVLGPQALCGPNTCNGMVMAIVEVMRADADGDGVENEDDFTPEPCDEEDKADPSNGVGLLMYYNYEDTGFVNLAQAVGTNLSKHYGSYDEVVLVADNATSNPNNVNADAFEHADLVFPPSRDGLLDAMQHLTASGRRFDVIVHSHGAPNGPDDARFEVLTGDPISGNWLIGATDPDEIGTARGGIPIVAFWTTACFAGYMADAWHTIGALVGSGAQNVSFYSAAYANYWDAWVAGTNYSQSVGNSVTVGIIAAAEVFVAAEGLLPPYFCATVLGKSACAEDFFNGDVGPHPAKYDLQRVYDHSKSGAQNMGIASSRLFAGNTAISFGGGQGASWP